MPSTSTNQTGSYLTRRSSRHPEARALYEEARRHWETRRPDSIRSAIRHLEKAISLDGSFALACAALADCYSILLDYGVISPQAGLTAARLASGRALHHAPELAESLTSAALVRQMDLDWASAEEEFQAAIAAHPEYTVARQRYALFLACMGRDHEARYQIDIAVRKAPGSPAVAATAAWVPYLSGQFGRAERIARDAVLRHPGLSSAQVVLALSMTASHRPKAASDVLEKACRREGDNVSLLSLLAFTRGKGGETRQAQELLDQLQKGASDRYVSPFYVAVAMAGIEARDQVFAMLGTARRERAPQLIYLPQDYIFATMRTDSRYGDLLLGLGLPFGVNARPEATAAAPPGAAVEAS
jgi:serine/threonine-protein kinase